MRAVVPIDPSFQQRLHSSIFTAASSQQLSRDPEVSHECGHGLLSVLGLAPAGWTRVHRRQDVRRKVRLEEPAALRGHPERRTEHRLGRHSAKEHKHVRLYHRQLRLEPRRASVDLLPVRLLVDATLPFGRPLEVLDGVGDIHALAVDARLVEGRRRAPAPPALRRVRLRGPPGRLAVRPRPSLRREQDLGRTRSASRSATGHSCDSRPPPHAVGATPFP